MPLPDALLRGAVADLVAGLAAAFVAALAVDFVGALAAGLLVAGVAGLSITGFAVATGAVLAAGLATAEGLPAETGAACEVLAFAGADGAEACTTALGASVACGRAVTVVLAVDFGAWFKMNLTNSGYTMSRQRRPLKMP